MAVDNVTLRFADAAPIPAVRYGEVRRFGIAPRTGQTKVKSRAGRPKRRVGTPTLAVERLVLAEGHASVAGMDEVGRGAWAGPLVIGVVMISTCSRRLPSGVRDSKLVSSTTRERLEPAIAEWCSAWAVGESSPAEIDRFGLPWALTTASRRALENLPKPPSVLLLDGSFDFVRQEVPNEDGPVPSGWWPDVRTLVRGDRKSGTIAAASIIAKVSRDRAMTQVSGQWPTYGFDQHKGYGTREHEEAIAKDGLTELHRRSWSFADRLCPDDLDPTGCDDTRVDATLFA